jgi:hypothetical protein
MKNQLKTYVFAVALSAVALWGPAAYAGAIEFTVAPEFVVVAPGDTITYSGTFRADATNTDIVYLTSLFVNLPGPFTVDDSLFWSREFSIYPGDTLVANLFTVTVGSTALWIPYEGTVEVSFGPDLTTTEDVRTDTFQVNVVPEPASLLFVGCGLGVLAGAVRRRRRA